jgi:hypothetical protein
MDEKIAQMAVLAREIQEGLIAKSIQENLTLEESNIKKICTTVQTECYHYSRAQREVHGRARRT